ncbi:hypothetical protein JOD45_002146 [Scopulibacillus daqui]|uniref:Uncharacterized protein n=1 Tax=Scopulibacillus daqui TaxID=1469162 RepID=A0ABS2Q1C3_9BACL|nr:hypothetical protein [Scopulibacillus daqui]
MKITGKLTQLWLRVPRKLKLLVLDFIVLAGVIMIVYSLYAAITTIL